jgi:hypothetical protein
MRKLFISCLAMGIGHFLASTVEAQVPGYLGKRIEVGLQLDVTNNPFEMGKAGMSQIKPQNGFVNPKIIPGLKVGAVLGRKLGAYVCHSFGNAFTYDEVGLSSAELTGGSQDVILLSWMKSRVSFTQFGLKLYSGNKGSIAPIGPYFSMYMSRLGATVSEYEYATYEGSSFLFGQGLTEENLRVDLKERYDQLGFEKHNLWSIGLGFGNAWIVAADRVKLDYQLMLNFALPNASSPSTAGYFSSEHAEDTYPNYISYTEDLDEHLSWQPILSLRRSMVTQMRLGIAYLL